jgi:hypothetical protein
MSHDQLFKDLLRAFFQEFMELFFPDVAARLDFARITFLDKELFTDLPEGEQRDADLVAEAYTVDGEPELILTHIEVQAWRRGTFPARMHTYYMMLYLRHRVPVLPIAIFLSPGAGGLTEEHHYERVFDRQVVHFTYSAVGLPDMEADDYLTSDSPLACALSALMRVSKSGKAAQKYVSLRLIAGSGMDDARKMLLANVVETYLMLNTEEKTTFEQLAAQPEAKEVREMISVYEERGIEKGITKGKRDMLLRMMAVKFGSLPNDVHLKLEAIESPDLLDTLSERFLTATSLEEMKIEAQ